MHVSLVRALLEPFACVIFSFRIFVCSLIVKPSNFLASVFTKEPNVKRLLDSLRLIFPSNLMSDIDEPSYYDESFEFSDECGTAVCSGLVRFTTFEHVIDARSRTT